MAFTPAQIALLSKLISNVDVQASAMLGVARKEAADAIARLQNLVNASLPQLRGLSFSLTLDAKAKGANALSFTALKQRVNAGQPVITVDLKGRVTAASFGGLLLKDAAARTAATHGLEILILEGYSYYVLDGKVIDEIDLDAPNATAAIGPRWRHPMSEFPKVLQVHMRERVAQEKGFTYWKDRARRILRALPEKTEAIFHRDLLWWIRNYTAGVIRTYSEPEGFGQDKTDIVAVTLAGGHVVEVKWLGVNENTTSYDRTRIDEGLVQVKQYLDRDADLVEGYLVVYDGRAANEHKNDSKFNRQHKHPLCREPQILYLENEVPTETSTRIVRPPTAKTKSAKKSTTTKTKQKIGRR
jgi:hypothetical protein